MKNFFPNVLSILAFMSLMSQAAVAAEISGAGASFPASIYKQWSSA